MNRDSAGRKSSSKSSSILSAAVAATALATLGMSGVTRAGLVIDVVAQPGTGYTVTGNGKTVHVGPGVPVKLAVYAQITGTNTTQLVGEYGGDPAVNDTKNDETLQIVTGSFASSAGGLLGNFAANPGPLNYNPRVYPFSANGSQNGVAADFDTDGDLDLGALGSDPTNMWVARTNSPTAAVVLDGTTNGWSKNSGESGVQDDNAVVDSATSRLRLATLFFTVTDTNKGSTLLNYIPRPDPGPGAALWWQDGVITGHTPGTDPVGTGAPVTVTVNPEPASGAMLALSSVGLLARWRRRQP
jgi:MYXO-CTERM domain-containing protein